MSDFTPEQQRTVMTYYREFQEALAGRACDAQLAEVLLADVFPNMDPEKLHQDCVLMEAGVWRFMNAYEASNADAGMNAADAIENITRDLNPQQRKGFYLSAYDMLREADSDICQEAEQAQEGWELTRELDEDEMRELLASQLDAHARVIAAECGDEDLTEESLEDTLPDPMVMAMANYAASVDGTLPEYYEKSPEIMGVFAASSCVMTQKIRENPDKVGNREWLSNLIVGIVGVALVAALAAWCAPAAIEGIKQVAVAISTGNVSFLLTKFKYPLIHFMRHAKYFLPAAAIAAMSGLKDKLEEGVNALRGVYGKVKSRIRTVLGKETVVTQETLVTQKTAAENRLDAEVEEEEDEEEFDDNYAD